MGSFKILKKKTFLQRLVLRTKDYFLCVSCRSSQLSQLCIHTGTTQTTHFLKPPSLTSPLLALTGNTLHPRHRRGNRINTSPARFSSSDGEGGPADKEGLHHRELLDVSHKSNLALDDLTCPRKWKKPGGYAAVREKLPSKNPS